MAEFPEPVKIEVKKKAAFQCCMCQSFGIHVHHIVQPQDGGSNDIDNAAPLCPNCHDAFGDNPKKRKEIRQRRDWWYAKVEEMFGGNVGLDVLGKIDTQLQAISQHQSTQETALNELKGMLRDVANNMINNITPATATTAVSSIIASSVRLGENVHANVVCRKCNTHVGLLVGSNTCPGCGEKLQ